LRGSSHVIFGLAGAVALDSVFHFSGPALIGAHAAPSADQIVEKVVFYGFAALGSLVPDIDNARSTLGQRLGPISKGIQHLAGHRTIFHSLLGLVLTGAVIWGAQFGLGWLLLQAGYVETAHALNVGLPPQDWVASGAGIGFVGLLVGYFLHLVADSLTEGGVPWLYPSRIRFGFPPNRKWRFKNGSVWEPVTLFLVCALVFAGLYFSVLAF
jgi:inner membrane protein